MCRNAREELRIRQTIHTGPAAVVLLATRAGLANTEPTSGPAMLAVHLSPVSCRAVGRATKTNQLKAGSSLNVHHGQGQGRGGRATPRGGRSPPRTEAPISRSKGGIEDRTNHLNHGHPMACRVVTSTKRKTYCRDTRGQETPRGAKDTGKQSTVPTLGLGFVARAMLTKPPGR